MSGLSLGHVRIGVRLRSTRKSERSLFAWRSRVNHTGKVVKDVYKLMVSQSHPGLPIPSCWPTQAQRAGGGEEEVSGVSVMRGSNSSRSRPMSFRDAPGSGHQQDTPVVSRVVRCLCSNNSWREGRMIKCSDSSCQAYQHLACISPPGGATPTDFYCDACRCERADPFWESVGDNVLPFTKLRYNGHQIQAQTLQQVQFQERAFQVRQPYLQKIMRRELRLQVVCLMLSDNVPHRYHWPKHCSLRVNNTQYRVYGRSQNNKLGNNQRDEPAIIDSLVRRDGKNSLHIECADNRHFAVSVQIVEKRSHAEVKTKMRRKESLNAATLRVIRQVKGGGGLCEGIETTSAVMSLKCPLSGMRIATPARFADIDLLEAVFDLDSFLLSAEKTRKWACPNSLKPSCVQNLQVDVYVERVLECLRDAPNINEVEVNPEGGWRPNGTDGPWRSIYDNSAVVDVKMEEDSDAMSEDEDSEDEYEEMRRAAAAMREHNEQVKREQNDKPEQGVDIIDLLSDDDDGDDNGRHQGKNSVGGAQGGSSGGAQRMPFGSAPFQYPPPPRSHPQALPSLNEVRPSISQAGSGYPGAKFSVAPSVGNIAHHVNPHSHHHHPPSTSFPPNYNQVRNFPAPVGINPNLNRSAMNALQDLSGWGLQRAQQTMAGAGPAMPGLVPVRNIPGSSMPVPYPHARGIPGQMMGSGAGVGTSTAPMGFDGHQRPFLGFGRGQGRGFFGQHQMATRRHPMHSPVMLQTGNEVTLRASDILGSGGSSGGQPYRNPDVNVEVIELDSDED